MCAQAAALNDEQAADLQVGGPFPLKDGVPGYAALGSTGYANNTQAVALGAASP